MDINQVKIINFNEHGDTRGTLVAIEENKDIPFDIKRVFYMYDIDKNIVRGNHANRNSEFVLICLSGSCKINVKDGNNSKEYILNKPSIGLYIPKMIWKEMYDFSENAVLLALSSHFFNENEYIDDFEQYKKEVNDND